MFIILQIYFFIEIFFIVINIYYLFLFFYLNISSWHSSFLDL